METVFFITNEFITYLLPYLMFLFGYLGTINTVYGTAVLAENWRYRLYDKSSGTEVLFYGILFWIAFLICSLLYKGVL